MSKGRVNRVEINGRVGIDPVVRKRDADTGDAVVVHSRLAHHRRRQADGQWVEDSEWHNLVGFGRTARTMEQQALKGREIVVEGELRVSRWETPEGAKRSTHEIHVDTFTITVYPRSEIETQEDEDEADATAPGRFQSGDANPIEDTPPPPADDFEGIYPEPTMSPDP